MTNWADDPNHPKWDRPVGYSHAAALLTLTTPSQAAGSILTA